VHVLEYFLAEEKRFELLSLYFKAIAFQAIPLDLSGTPPVWMGFAIIRETGLVDCQGLEPRVS
jgi:hypothetical protein